MADEGRFQVAVGAIIQLAKIDKVTYMPAPVLALQRQSVSMMHDYFSRRRPDRLADVLGPQLDLLREKEIAT